MPNTIDTDRFSATLREQSVRGDAFLISRMTGSEQEQDLAEPPVCDGFGRIRHFHRATAPGWPPNPLPIDPCICKLGLAPSDSINALVYQNAACNWRCWYCYVPFNLLAANERHAGWLTAQEMVNMYLGLERRPPLIDLSGGQPDLIPEWTVSMMRALQAAEIADQVYLWSDDNLSNDYFWRFISADDLLFMRKYNNYGRVCCFKGFDSRSFSFNTKADPVLFDRQFRLFSRMLETGLDVYAYATFTTPQSDGIASGMEIFVDRLQAISRTLPLRTVPLEIREFGPVAGRLDAEAQQRAIANQEIAIGAWNDQIERRFSPDERGQSIVDVRV